MLPQPEPLDLRALEEGVGQLSALDPDLAGVSGQLGVPPLWQREPGFPTLIHIILEQQVSLASARAAHVRLQQRLGTITPAGFLTLVDDELKEIGFSRQKTGYGRGLASSIVTGDLDLQELGTLDDELARRALINIKGIGPWTADIYLLMALLRPDIWPVGDLALVSAVQEIKKLPARPGPVEMESIAAPWRPWRAVAARLLWSYYLSSRHIA